MHGQLGLTALQLHHHDACTPWYTSSAPSSRRARWCQWPSILKTYGTLGARGDAYTCATYVVRNYVRPAAVTWLATHLRTIEGPKFVDYGGRFSIFLRRLRELS